MKRQERVWRELPALAVGGAVAFWVANFAISRTPIAAEYRAALSIDYFPMLLEALLGGLILGALVGFSLLRHFDAIPMRSPILKSVFLSSIALIVLTVLIEAPSKLLTPAGDAWRYFLIAALFNVLRILALGLAVGYLYLRLHGCEGVAAR